MGTGQAPTTEQRVSKERRTGSGRSGSGHATPRRACPTTKNSKKIYALSFVCLFFNSPLSPPKAHQKTRPGFSKPPTPSIRRGIG